MADKKLEEEYCRRAAKKIFSMRDLIIAHGEMAQARCKACDHFYSKQAEILCYGCTDGSAWKAKEE